MLSAYDVQVEGHRELLNDLTLAGDRSRMALRDLVDDVTGYARRGILMYVHGRLAAKIGRRRARVVAPDTYEGETGATGYEEWPLYVHGGTGIYRLENPDYIRPRDDRAFASVIATGRHRLTAAQGGMLRFMWNGVVTYRRQVEGQPANPFVKRAYGPTKIYARARARRLPLTILNRR